MSAESVLVRMRMFLLWLAFALCVGTVVELWLTEHTETAVQWVPFVLCALGAILLLVAILRPRRSSVLALRAIMTVAALGGLFGTYQHLESNLEFAREVNVAQAEAAPLWAALTGANPPLAPGILGAMAVIALAATYAHPALEPR
jgi:hypothetical protein